MALWLTVQGDEFERFPHHNTTIFYSVLILNTNRPKNFFLLLAPRFLGPALVGVLRIQTARDLAAPVLAGAGEVTQKKSITPPTMNLGRS